MSRIGQEFDQGLNEERKREKERGNKQTRVEKNINSEIIDFHLS